MKAELEVSWLPKTWTTGNATVKEVKEVIADGKKDKQFTIEADGNLYRMSVWGYNWNACVKKWGNDTDHWIGKSVFILREERPNEGSKIVLSPI